MNRPQLRRDIKSKFGTVARFARVAGLDTAFVWNVLSNRTQGKLYYNQVNAAFDRFKSYIDPYTLTDQERAFIDRKIFKHFRTPARLSQRYPLFSPVFLSNIIRGRALKKTKHVEKLVNILVTLEMNSE